MLIRHRLRVGIKVRDWKIRKLLSLRKGRKFSQIWGMINRKYWNISSSGMIREGWSILPNGKRRKKPVKTKMHK